MSSWEAALAPITLDRVTKTFPDGTTAVSDLSLEVEDGEFLILLGPSGCGKTTALRIVAGLEEATSGAVMIDGKIVNDVESVDRDIAMVFQNYALYPHMRVRDNIGFPLRLRHEDRAEVSRRVGDVSKLLGLEDLLDRRPRELSGGQRQRVAMARAIIRHPQAFLMDEPLSNLDAKLRVQTRAHLATLHQRLRVTTLYVTHDQSEAMTLGSRVAVMRDGALQQIDTPQAIYKKPRNTFVAQFIGSPQMSFFTAHLDGSTLSFAGATADIPRAALAQNRLMRGEVVCGIRPEDIVLSNGRLGEESVQIRGELALSEHLGSDAFLYVACGELHTVDIGGSASPEMAGLLTARAGSAFTGHPGEVVSLDLPVGALHFFDPVSGITLRKPETGAS